MYERAIGTVCDYATMYFRQEKVYVGAGDGLCVRSMGIMHG